jgi:hypothetical protein
MKHKEKKRKVELERKKYKETLQDKAALDVQVEDRFKTFYISQNVV